MKISFKPNQRPMLLLMRACLLITLLLLPFHSRALAQAEVGLIINAILQGLQTAEAIRRSVDASNQFPNPPNQPAGDPIWNYDEASLIPTQVLRTGPYRNVQGQIILSARKTKPREIELIFYRSDESVYRREFCQSDQRDGRRFDLDEKGKKTAEGPIRKGVPEGDWLFFSAEGKIKAETRMQAGQMTGPQVLFGEDGKTRASNTLLEGKRQGPSTLFHPDGSVSDNLFYSADKLNGPATGWWSDGLPRYTANWKNGQLDGPSVENFPSGMKKSETFYRFGKKEGVARQWDERGTLLTEENWQSDQLDGRVR
jgi:antitoxin component YwqK of YwqJK toxin-antitoxin module